MKRLMTATATTSNHDGAMTSLTGSSVERDFDPDDFDPDDFDTRSSGAMTFLRASIDTDGTEIAVPANRGSVQRVGVRLFTYKPSPDVPFGSGGVIDIDLTDYLLSWSAEVSIGQPASVAQVTLAVPDDGSPWGDLFSSGVPSFGMRDVTLGIWFRAGGKTYTRAIVPGGYVDSQNDEDDNPHTESITIHGVMRRWMDIPVTFTRPPGHRSWHGEVINRILGKAKEVGDYAGLPLLNSDVPDKLRGEVRMTKPVNLTDQAWFPTVQEIAQIFGGYVFNGERGTLKIAYDRPEEGSPRVRGVIDESVILRSVNGQSLPVSVTGSPNPPQELTVSGHEQITRDQCGTETIPLPTTVTAIYRPPNMPLEQTGGGTVSQTPSASLGLHTYSEIGRKVQEILTELQKDCETIVGSITEETEWYNLEQARYQLDSNLGIGGYHSCFLPEGATKDSTDAGFRWGVERYRRRRRSIEGKAYNDAGQLVSEFEEREGWKLRRAYMLTRISRTTSWEDVGGGATTRSLSQNHALGSGECVHTETPRWETLERVTVDYKADDENFITEKVTTTQRWALAAGWEYLYFDGTESSDSRERFQTVEVITETWQRIGDEDRHRYRREVDFPLAVRDPNRVSVETRQGQPPAIEKRSDVEPVRSDFETDSEFEQAQAAFSTDQQPWEYKATNDRILSDENGPGLRAPRAPVHVSSRLIPNEIVGRAWANREVLRGEAMHVDLWLPPFLSVSVGQWWHFRIRTPDRNFDQPGMIESMRYGQSAPGEANIVNATVRVYPQ